MFGVLHINQYKRPHIGKLIKELRNHKGISQEALARAAFFNRSTLSQVELGNIDCPENILLSIKTVLDVASLPMRDAERDDYRNELYKWHDVINERKVDEAKELHAKLSCIKFLPSDIELNGLFALFECKLLLLTNELEAAKMILDKLSTYAFSDIQLYHYCYNQGTYNIKIKRNQEALDFYLKAYEFEKHQGLEKNVALYYNIAIAYRRIGLHTLATAFAEEARTIKSASKGNVPMLSIFILLGVLYVDTKHLQRAKHFLDKAHKIALHNFKANENADTKAHLGMVFANYGYLYRMAGKRNMSIEHLDKALKYIKIESGDDYLETLYQKTRCLIEMDNTFPCAGLIAEGIKLSENNEVYTIMFETLQRIINIDDNSARHIEANALPYLVKHNYVRPALDYAMFLRDYFFRKGRGTKTLAYNMSELALTIKDLIHKGGVIE